MIVLPVDYPNGVPRNPALYEAVQEFCEAEFGERLNFGSYTKAWAAVEADGEGYAVYGVTAIALAVDCPVFHVHKENERDDRDRARAVRDMLLLRTSSAIQDNYGAGLDVLVHVAPEKERFWAGYLRMIGAKPANRFIVKV